MSLACMVILLALKAQRLASKALRPMIKVIKRQAARAGVEAIRETLKADGVVDYDVCYIFFQVENPNGIER